LFFPAARLSDINYRTEWSLSGQNVGLGVCNQAVIDKGLDRDFPLTKEDEKRYELSDCD
jgi:hypothetical protein